MKNKFIIYSVLVGVLSVGFLAFAEDGENNPSPLVSSKPSTRVEVREQKDQLRQNVKSVKDDDDNDGILDKNDKQPFDHDNDGQNDDVDQDDDNENSSTNIKAEAENAREQLKNTAQAVREDLKKRKEEFDNMVKTKKAELENEIKTKREELKTNLKKIKDDRKKQTVEKVDQQIDELNAKMVKHFSSVLDKLEEMLVRISERADKASSEKGLDVSLVRSAIDKAKIAIASARSAIEVQTGKTYAIKVTTEKTLKAEVGKARQALGADLAKVRDVVKAAQSSVKDAAVALAQLHGKNKVSPSPSVSPSVSPSPTAVE